MIPVVAGLLLALATATPVMAEADGAEIEFWRSVKETADPAELEAYLKAYPEGEFAPLARIRLKGLKGEEDTEAETDTSTSDDGKESPPQTTPKDDKADDRLEQSEGKATATKDDRLEQSEDTAAPGKEDEADEATASPPPAAADTQEVKVTLGAHPKNAKKGALGVIIMDVTSNFAKPLGLDVTKAALVSSVNPGSAADKAGVKPGYVVVAIDGITVTGSKRLADVVSKNPPGATISLKFIALAPSREALEDLLGSKADSAPEIAYALAHITKDKNKAAELFRKAAEQDYVPAILSLGRAYVDGQGVKRDRGKAAEWYRKAANRGSASAMSDLGYMYEKGIGVTRDYKEAFQWYQKASDKGVATAQNNLGLLYDKGNGAPRDSRQAARFLLQAYRTGNVYAQQNLEKNSSGLSSDTRRDVQRLLQEEGVYSGRIDGKLGPATRRALKELTQTQVAQKPDEAAPSQEAATGPSLDEQFGDLSDLDELD